MQRLCAPPILQLTPEQGSVYPGDQQSPLPKTRTQPHPQHTLHCSENIPKLHVTLSSQNTLRPSAMPQGRPPKPSICNVPFPPIREARSTSLFHQLMKGNHSTGRGEQVLLKWLTLTTTKQKLQPWCWFLNWFAGKVTNLLWLASTLGGGTLTMGTTFRKCY